MFSFKPLIIPQIREQIMNKRLSISIATTFLFLFLTGCQDEEQINQNEPITRPVKFFEITETSSQKTSQFPATITAANTSELSFQVAGQITEFDLKESDEVSEGQIIAQLDDRDYRNQYNALKAQYDNAVTEFNRSENLLAQDAIAKNVVEQRKSQMDVLKSQLDVAKEALDDTTLKAPFSGTVSNVSVEKFQNIQHLQTIVTIINEKSLEANANIPASILSQSPNNDIVSATLAFEAIPDLSIPATFKEIALTADPTTQTYLVKFQFDAPTEALILPGMNGNLTVVAASNDPTKAGVTTVPISAIQSSSDSTFVWLINEDDMTVSKQIIRVKAAVGAMIPVTEGLEVGDVIAAAGGAYLAEGMKIKQWSDQ